MLELDIDGVFKRLLLLKKKKYAALVAEKVNGSFFYRRELKGIDSVRRDWSIVAKTAGSYVFFKFCRLLIDLDIVYFQTGYYMIVRCVVDILLSDIPRQELVEKVDDYLTQLGSSIKDGQLSVDQYIISKVFLFDSDHPILCYFPA